MLGACCSRRPSARGGQRAQAGWGERGVLRERVTACLVTAPAVPVSPRVPKAWQSSPGAWRQRRRSRCRRGCAPAPSPVPGGDGPGLPEHGLRPRCPEAPQRGSQRVRGESSPTGSGLLGTEVRNGRFPLGVWCPAGRSPIGERAEPAVTYIVPGRKP